MRQVAGSLDDHAANIRRTGERVCKLERGPGKIVEERHEVGTEAPEGNTGQAVGIGEEACDARVEPRLAATRGDGSRRPAPLGQERREGGAGEDVVGAGDQRGSPGAAGEGAAHGVGGTVGPRLADVADPDAERRAVAQQLLDLLGEVAGHHRHVVAPCASEIAQQRRDHGTSVDREDRLRPALADRPHAGSGSRGHDDRLH